MNLETESQVWQELKKSVDLFREKDKRFFIEKVHPDQFSAGQADLLGCYRGIRLDFELKIDPNVPTLLQVDYLLKLFDAGGYAAVITVYQDQVWVFPVCEYEDDIMCEKGIYIMNLPFIKLVNKKPWFRLSTWKKKSTQINEENITGIVDGTIFPRAQNIPQDLKSAFILPSINNGRLLDISPLLTRLDHKINLMERVIYE